MKTTFALLFAAMLLCGCQKTAAPPAATKIQKWEYKVVQVENYAHYTEKMAVLNVMKTNSDLATIEIQYAEKDCGSFDFDSTYLNEKYGDQYAVDFDKLGADGWELISAVPKLETLPNVEYGSEVNPHTFNNTRTATIILLFKRPK